MKISIIHPSRGRPEMAFNTFIHWTKRMKTTTQEYEYILSLDTDDRCLGEYNYRFRNYDVFTTIHENKNVVDAMNAGAFHAFGNLLVCISDDFECFQGWDIELMKLITSDVQAIQVKDGIINEPHSAYFRKHRKFEHIMTLPIMTMGLYKKLGYVYYPEFTGMFADNDLAEQCFAMGVLTLSNLMFKHNHFTITKKEDETYKRHNNQQSWDIGEALIKKRRLQRK